MHRYETLRRRRDIDCVFEDGRWQRTRSVNVGVLQRDDTAPVRVCFVTGRRIGNAVKRNRARRRLREAFRAAARGLSTSADVVVLARASAHEARYVDLVEAIRGALAHEGLLGSGPGSGDGRR